MIHGPIIKEKRTHMSNNTPRTWNEFFEEAEAAVSGSAEAEPTPESARLQARQEARDIANSVLLSTTSGAAQTGNLASPLGEEASAKDIASRVRLNGRTGGEPPQIKRAARFIDPLNR